jgi:hypothetical protein
MAPDIMQALILVLGAFLCASGINALSAGGTSGSLCSEITSTSRGPQPLSRIILILTLYRHLNALEGAVIPRSNAMLDNIPSIRAHSPPSDELNQFSALQD